MRAVAVDFTHLGEYHSCKDLQGNKYANVHTQYNLVCYSMDLDSGGQAVSTTAGEK